MGVKSLPRPCLRRVGHDAHCAIYSRHYAIYFRHCAFVGDLCGCSGVNIGPYDHELVRAHGMTPNLGVSELSTGQQTGDWHICYRSKHTVYWTGMARHDDYRDRHTSHCCDDWLQHLKEGGIPLSYCDHTPAQPLIQLQEWYRTHVCNPCLRLQL
jgi:hypothetical protein